MTDRRNQPRHALAEQQEAIRDYLDALLQEIPDFDDASAQQVQAQPGETASQTAREELAPATGTAAPEPVAEVQQQPHRPAPAETELEPEPVATDPHHADTELEAQELERGALQALFFDVGGLRLAVPLTELHSVVPWGDVDVTPMPCQPDWQLGLMRYRERHVRVVDTVTMVLPPDKRQTPEAQAEPQHILVVGDGTWGITCHGIGDVLRLGPDEVKWRRRGSARPWLAGTVIGHLSAVIDTGAFARMLQQGAGQK